MAEAVIDTCFFIDLRSGRNLGARRLWEQIRASSLSASYAAVTVLELWRGRLMDREEESFRELTMSFMLEEPITSASAKLAGLWLRPFGREMARQLLGDALMAAVAVLRGIPVYTSDRSDFERFPVQAIEY